MLASVVVIGAGVLAYEGPGSGPAQPPREAPAKAPRKSPSIEDEQAKADVESARQNVLVIEARLKQAEADLERAKAQMEVANMLLKQTKLNYDAARARAANPQREPSPLPALPKAGRDVLQVRGYLRSAWAVQVTPTVVGKVFKRRLGGARS